MPQVRAYEQTQATRPLPGPAGPAAPTADDLGAGIGSELQQLGTGIVAVDTAEKRAQEKKRLAAEERARELADQVRVDDALNQVKERSLDLTFGQSGYKWITGRDALDRPSKMPLANEYATELDKRISEVTQTLGTERQKQQFGLRVNDVRTTFYGQARQHEGEQSQKFAISTDTGTIANAQNTIGVFYRDPKQVDEAVKSIEAAVARTGRLLGRSATEIDSDTRKATSNAHLLAIQGAVQQGDSVYAEAYLKHYAKQMDAGDILKVQGQITKDADIKIGAQVADKVFREAAPAIHGNDFERAVGITKGTESGNRQFDAQGKPLRSSAGAIGIMQVMEGTGPEAAKLAGLPWDRDKWLNDARYNEALGRAYLAQQLRDFGGDLGKAWAAYNAGPAATKAAIAKAAKVTGEFADVADKSGIPASSYLKYLPKETQDYVAKNVREYQAGGGRPKAPTLETLQDQLRENPVLAARPGALKAAIESVTQRFVTAEKAIKQNEETGLADAQRWLVANNGDFANMPANLRGAIPPGKYDDVLGFAGKLSRGAPVETNWTVYERLRTEARERPQEFARLDLGSTFHVLAPAQREALIDLQDKVKKDPKAVAEVATLDAQLGDAHDKLGLTGTSNAEKRGLFDETVRREISAAQATKGKALTYEERQAVIDRNAVKRNQWFGTTRLFEFREEWGDIKQFIPEIPKGDVEQITRRLKERGEKVTADRIMQMYRSRVGLLPRTGATGEF